MSYHNAPDIIRHINNKSIMAVPIIFCHKNDPGICSMVSIGVFAEGKDLDCSGG